MHHSPLVIADARPGNVALGLQMLRNCTETRIASTSAGWYGPSTAATALQQLRAETGIRYDECSQARCSSSARRKLDGIGKDVEILSLRRPFQIL